MRDGPRWLTIINLLHTVLDQGISADLAVRRWSKASRFAGSKDRRFVGDTLFDLCRQLGRLQWQLEATGGNPVDTRALALAYLGDDARMLFDGSDHAPAPLSGEEEQLLAALDGLTDEPPVEAQLSVPDWALPGMQKSFGDGWQVEAEALLEQPAVDLRMRDLGRNRDDMLKNLGARGLDVLPTPYSPLGLRLQGRFAAGDVPELNDGQLEIQDEASQLAALLVGVEQGMQVLDLCAGAGGKSLVMAANLRGQGQVLAVDRDEYRLQEAGKRARRAKLPWIKTLCADAINAPDEALAGRWDRILVDAPCTGTGTWRRSPDARWRMNALALAELTEVQAALLDRAAGLVRPGGQIAYVTCSLLAEENTDQIVQFLSRHEGFEVLSFETVWQDALEEYTPPSVLLQPHGWLMTPAQHGTDGFFMTVLRRAG